MRRAGILSALLVTAALLCAMPGLARLPRQQGRADESLRPAQIRPLTVWFMPGDVGDRKLISQLCTAFEKERPGVRVFLRVVTAEEFTGEDAVLPDAALFETGDIAMPEKVFLPLQASHPSGMYAGVCYAVPLWLSPDVLSIPQAWLQNSTLAEPRRDSLLASATAEPPTEHSGVLSAQELPWELLTRPGAVAEPAGIAAQQLLAICPGELRGRLVSGVLKLRTETASDEWVTTLPKAAKLTSVPDLTAQARMETLAQHRSREGFVAHVPEVAVSQRVRYAALCRENEDARAFMQFLTEHRGMAVSHSLIPPGAQNLPGDALTVGLVKSYQSAALPNAFAHSRQEIAQICQQSFARCDDPVQTLLRLR